MNVNPYESPRLGEPTEEKPMGDSDDVRQILIEIRDMQRERLELQREMLAFQREAMARTQRLTKFSRLFMIVPILFAVIPFYFLYQTMTRVRTLPQTPIRVPARPLP